MYGAWVGRGAASVLPVILVALCGKKVAQANLECMNVSSDLRGQRRLLCVVGCLIMLALGRPGQLGA